MGHEFGINVPYDNTKPDSPGFGVHYIEDNIAKSFINLNVDYLNGLGEKTYGFDLTVNLSVHPPNMQEEFLYIRCILQKILIH